MKIKEITNEGLGVAWAGIKSAFSDETAQNIRARDIFTKNFVSKMTGNINSAISGGLISVRPSISIPNKPSSTPNSPTSSQSTPTSSPTGVAPQPTTPPTPPSAPPTPQSAPVQQPTTPQPAAPSSPAQVRANKLKNAQAVAQRQMNTGRITEAHYEEMYALIEATRIENSPDNVTDYVLSSIKKMLGPVRYSTNRDKIYPIAAEIEKKWNSGDRKTPLVKMANIVSAIASQGAYNSAEDGQPSTQGTGQVPPQQTQAQAAPSNNTPKPKKVDIITKQLNKMTGLTSGDYDTLMDTLDAKLRSENNPALLQAYRDKLRDLRSNV